MSWINKIKDKSNLVFGFFIAQLFLMSTAFAQFAEPGAGDISRSFLNEIFGGLLDGGQNAFGPSIATFNGAILTVGGILAAYTILAGTLGTAHDGEMLGKKFSSVYIPIRYALGTALVLPILSGGYCVMQALVMWIIMQGAGLGNIVWKAYSSSPPALKAPISTSTKAAIKKIVEDIYVAQVCVEANQKSYNESPTILQRTGTYQYNAKRVDDSNGRYVWEFGDHGGKIGSVRTCGYITEPKKPEVKINSFSAAAVSSLRGVENSFQVVDLTPIYTTHVSEIAKVVQKTGELAKQSILKEGTINYSQLQVITDEYIAAINASSTGVADAQSALQNSANEQGWFMAGTWVTKIIFAQNKINSMANQTATSNITIYKNTDSVGDNVSRFAANGYSVIVQQRPEITGAVQNSSDIKTSSSAGNSTTLGGALSSTLSNFVVGIDLEDIKNDQRHPLIVMVRVGDGILGAVLTGISLAAAAALVAGATVLGTGAGTTASTFIIFSTLAGPFLAFIGTGAMLTFILPNLPFMIWMGIIIGWSIMAIEAIVAAPLWAVMHLHPNGDDLTGRGGNGYMLVLGLLLRPALIIFGLIASIVLSGLFGQFVNRVFFEVFSANMGDSGVGFFAMIFGTGVYAAIMMTVIKQTFNLMHVIPDQLMRWIGGGGEQLGQYAGGFSGEGMAKAAAAGGAVAGYMASGAVKDVGSAISQGAQTRANNLNRQATLDQTANDKKMAGSAFNSKIGASDDIAGNIANSINKENGGQVNSQTGEVSSPKSGTLEAARASNGIAQAQLDVSNANDTLGGTGSIGAETYKAELNKNLANGGNFKDAHSAAFSKGADDKWGNGAGAAISKLESEGSTVGQVVSSLNNKQKNIQSLTKDSEKTHEMMSSMFKNADNISSSSGSSYSSAIKQASDSVKTDLGTIGGSSIGNSASAPPPPPAGL